MGDGGELVLELSFSGQVFELIDILLEPVIRGPTLIFAQFLKESAYVLASLYFGIKGVEILVIVHNKFIECLVFGLNAGVGHFVVPFLQESNTFSSAHFTKNKGNFEFVGGVDPRVDGEVCFHGLEPL